MTSTRDTPSTPRPILMALSILAGLKVLTSAAVFTDLIGTTAAGLVVATLAAVDVGLAFYLQGQVVPLANVIYYERGDYVYSGGAGPTITPPVNGV